MVLAIELIITLLLGFVLGRIWQIRQQILLAEYVDRRHHPFESAMADQGSARSQAAKPSLSDDRNNNLPVVPVSAVRLRGGTAPIAGRFHALHQHLHHAAESIP